MPKVWLSGTLRLSLTPWNFTLPVQIKNENSVLRAKAATPEMKGECPAPLEASDTHVSHFDASQLKDSVTHFLSLFGQEHSDRC